MGVLRLLSMAADAQHLKVCISIVVLQSVFMMYMKIFAVGGSREVSATHLASPAAFRPEARRNSTEIIRIIVNGCRVGVTRRAF